MRTCIKRSPILNIHSRVPSLRVPSLVAQVSNLASRVSSGSVLVFAVVVLAVLAMLTSAFLIVTRHAIAASKSGLVNMQVDGVMIAGHNRAHNFLGQTTRGPYTATSNGVVALNPIDGQLELIGADDFQNKGAASNSPINMFVHNIDFDIANPTGQIKVPSYALLSNYRFNPLYNQTQLQNQYGADVYNAMKSAPYYTQAPLRLSTEALDFASSYYVRSGMVEFFNGVPSTLRKQLGASGTVRGRHFVWVRDLDANFYLVPARWGLRAPGTALGAYTQAEKAMATNILEFLRSTPSSEMKDVMHPGDPAFIAGLARDSNFDSISAFSLLFTGYDDTIFPYWRADLENYFTAYLDIGRNSDHSLKADAAGNYYSQFKEAPAGININTAPEEVVQAMISQIPAYDPVNKTDRTFATYFPPVPANWQGPAPCLAELVAKRIIAKRPFLCRMDFEDFVASLLPGDSNNPANTDTPFGAIKYAIQKRYEPTLNGGIGPELSLSQFMEIPGLPEGDFPDGRINPYKGSNTRLRQAQRFEYFANDLKVPGDPASGAIVPSRADCMLTVRTFNNLLNSVSSSPGPAFKVKELRMRPGETGTPNKVVMSFESNDPYSPLVIRVGGDDIYDPATHEVKSGPNGIAETAIFGYSYYSHDNVPPSEYRPIRNKAIHPEMDEAYCTNPAKVGKFVYGITGDLEPSNPAYKNYFLGDLLSWSCVGDGVMSGYYDMWFNFNDAMVMELGEKSEDMPPDESKPSIHAVVEGQPIISGINSPATTDTQEIPLGQGADEGSIIVTPGPSGELQTTPNTVPSVVTQPPNGDDKVVKAIRLSKNFPTTFPDENSNDNFYFFANDGYDYIVSTDNTPLKTNPAPPDPDNPDPTDVDKLVDIIVDGGNGVSDTSTQNDDKRMPDPVADHIEIGFNLINESYVWGPVRACQRDVDQIYNLDQVPSVAYTLNPPAATSLRDDVAWSPPVCYRSRFFGVYVLAQGLSTRANRVDQVSNLVPAGTNGPISYQVTLAPGETSADFAPYTDQDGTPQPPKWDLKAFAIPGAIVSIAHTVPGVAVPKYEVYSIDSANMSAMTGTITLTAPLRAAINPGDKIAIYNARVTGERRIESTFDAYSDEILWSRTPLTDKRALGDPILP